MIPDTTPTPRVFRQSDVYLDLIPLIETARVDVAAGRPWVWNFKGAQKIIEPAFLSRRIEEFDDAFANKNARRAPSKCVTGIYYHEVPYLNPEVEQRFVQYRLRP